MRRGLLVFLRAHSARLLFLAPFPLSLFCTLSPHHELLVRAPFALPHLLRVCSPGSSLITVCRLACLFFLLPFFLVTFFCPALSRPLGRYFFYFSGVFTCLGRRSCVLWCSCGFSWGAACSSGAPSYCFRLSAVTCPLLVAFSASLCLSPHMCVWSGVSLPLSCFWLGLSCLFALICCSPLSSSFFASG